MVVIVNASVKRENKINHNWSVDWTIGLNVNNQKRAKLSFDFRIFMCLRVTKRHVSAIHEILSMGLFRDVHAMDTGK